MSTHLLFAGTGNVVPGVGVACLNVIVALALVVVGVSLVLAVSSVAWLSDRHQDVQPIRGSADRRALA